MSSTALFTTIPTGVQIQIIIPKPTCIFSTDKSSLGYSIKCQTMGGLEIIWAQRYTASCMHVPALFQAAARGFVPRKDPINARTLSLVPGYHSFPKWAIGL